MALLDRILSGLTEAPRRLPVSADAEPGIYAWWSKPEASGMPIPEYPGCPRCRGLVSPLLRHRTKLAKERGLLSTRIDGDHSHGSIGNSTFRQTLAALLRARLQLEPLLRHATGGNSGNHPSPSQTCMQDNINGSPDLRPHDIDNLKDCYPKHSIGTDPQCV